MLKFHAAPLRGTLPLLLLLLTLALLGHVAADTACLASPFAAVSAACRSAPDVDPLDGHLPTSCSHCHLHLAGLVATSPAAHTPLTLPLASTRLPHALAFLPPAPPL